MVKGTPVDLKEPCNRWPWGTTCKCVPKCAVCGWGKHMAIHGGVIDKPGYVFGHEFVPKQAASSTTVRNK